MAREYTLRIDYLGNKIATITVRADDEDYAYVEGWDWVNGALGMEIERVEELPADDVEDGA